MPRKSRNTKRGAIVQTRKRKAQHKWGELLRAKVALPSLSLRSLALRHGVCSRALQARWRRYSRAAAAGDEDAITTASSNNRGGHNRAFTEQQEAVLAAQIKAGNPALTHTAIQGAALSLKRSIRIADGGRGLGLRRQREFHASNGFITDFKRRNRLSSHVMRPRKATAAADLVQQQNDVMQFVHDAREAADAYGKRLVLNMDETPVPKVEHPHSGVVATASGLAAPCSTTAGNRLNTTCFCCISAAGDKLPMGVVLRGKTQRVVNNLLRDAPAAVHRARFYFSKSGWVNAGIIIRWLHDVVRPFTGGEPAALLLDDYTAHWTEEVEDCAYAMDLQLIHVPPKQTIEYQPLDVCYHGPMVKRRQQLWATARSLFPDTADSKQASVERAVLAYESMSRKAGVDAFRKAYVVD